MLVTEQEKGGSGLQRMIEERTGADNIKDSLLEEGPNNEKKIRHNKLQLRRKF